MDRDFADILKQIGCTDGLHVPVANEENRRLQNEVSMLNSCKIVIVIDMNFTF